MLDPIFEIKSRLSIEELVSQYVQLKKAGRNYKALCPFHQEKSPSFIVSPAKQMAYCFGCHRGGDIFSFIQEVEGLDFGGALRLLADKIGVRLERQITGIKKEKKEIFFFLHEQACQFFEHELWYSDEGFKVIDYLHRRGMNDETLRKYRLGFAPDSFEKTYGYLVKKGFSQTELVEAGLALAKDDPKDDRGQLFLENIGEGQQGILVTDRFRLRLIFPISDIQGRIIAFGGRVLRKGDEPKYINSPETPIYHKSQAVYGFSEAKSDIRQKKQVVLVEGYMDVLASVQAGVHNTVAVSGTALTEEHVHILKRYADTFILAFDNDQAGHEATRRAIPMLQKNDLAIRIVSLQNVKDPGEFAVSSTLEWKTLATQAPSYMDYYFGYYQALEHSGISDRKDISHELIVLISGIKNRIERDQIVKKLALILEVSTQLIYDELNRFIKSLSQRVRHQSSILSLSDRDTISSHDSDVEYLLALFLQWPDCGDYVRSMCEKKGLFNSELAKYISLFSTHCDVNKFLLSQDRSLSERLKIKMLWLETYHPEWRQEDIFEEIKKVVDRILVKHYDNIRRDLLQCMIKAREEGRFDRVKEIFEQYVTTFDSKL